MSLHACTVCGKQISTKAERCPHCGRKPDGGGGSDVPVPFLISAAEARKRKVKCRECGNEVSLGAGSCPSCGFANPAEPRSRWVLMTLLAIVLGGAGSAAAWRMGLIEPRPRVGVSVAADSAAVESNFNWNTPNFRRDPPRTRSARFGAACPSPAPVLVYQVDSTPSMFRIQLALATPDPNRLTDSLVARYQLKSAGYDRKRGGIFVWQVSPAVVAALRCESGVTSIEQISR